MINWKRKAKISIKVLSKLISFVETCNNESEETIQKKERALFILGRDSVLSKLDSLEEKKQIKDLIFELNLAVIYWKNQGYNWDAEVYQEIIDILSPYVKNDIIPPYVKN